MKPAPRKRVADRADDPLAHAKAQSIALPFYLPMTLTEMRSWLSKRNIQLTRSLGQNFLHDGNQLRRIVEAAQLKPADKVLEIGPGLGPLTELLAAQAGEVLAIEMDARLVEVLCERFHLATRPGEFPAPDPVASAPGEEPAAAAGAPDNLFLVHDDALAYLRREPRDWSDWKLVANLP